LILVYQSMWRPFIGVAGLAVIAGEASCAGASGADADACKTCSSAPLADDPNVAAADAAISEAADASRASVRPLEQSHARNHAREFRGLWRLYAGTDRAETTYSLASAARTGRRSRRPPRASPKASAISRGIGADLERLDVLEEVEHAFIDAQAAEAALAVAEERLAVAQDLAEAVNRRVQAARDPFMAGSRAQARLAEAEIEAQSARRGAISARERLASYWNGASDFRVELTSFERLGDAPRDVLQAPIPDLQLGAARQARAEAQLRLERARRIPDVDLQVGLREFSDTDETALVVGFAAPLQLWDRNSDNVTRARAERDRAGHQREALARAAARQRGALLNQMGTARLEVEGLDARVIPSSEEALRFARDGYVRGAFSYIDVLEAQRALTEARLRRIASLRSYHRALASLERLAGARAEEIFQ
jgi:cobalt-zinc-cadmium efflux system outer membrane protein